MYPIVRALVKTGCLIGCSLYSFIAQSQGIHKLWGSAHAGGANNDGTVFSVQYDGHGPLLQASLNSAGVTRAIGSFAVYNKKLYGLAMFGGPANKGSLFEFDPYTNSLVKKYDFNGLSGGEPSYGLTLFKNMIYGVTFVGGVNDLGVIFAFDPATGVYTKLRDMNTATGSKPACELLPVGDKLYGTTAIGGTHNAGVLFEFDPATNAYTVKAHFNGANGLSPCGNLVYYNNRIYGTAVYSGANGKGTLFEFDPVTNAFNIRHHFASSAQPQNGLLEYNGRLYGVTKRGGVDNSGTFYSFDLATSGFSKLFEFNGAWGVYPTGLVQNQNRIYLLSNDLGAYSSGTVVEYDPAANTFTKKADLNYITTGAHPYFVNLVKMEAEVSPAVTGSCVDMQTITINAGNTHEWVAVTDALGNAVAEIRANGNILGTVRTSVFINSGATREDVAHIVYLDRNLSIIPQFAPTSPVDIRLYLRGSEFSKLKGSVSSTGLPSSVNTIADVGIYRNDDPCSQKLGATAPALMNSGATWALNDYVISASVNSLSSFYFAGKFLQLLPTSITNFNVIEKKQQAVLQWTATEDNTSSRYIIERSTDGRQFEAIATIKAAGTNGNHTYNWIDTEAADRNYYRIKFIHQDASFGYSVIRKLLINGGLLDATVYDGVAGTAVRISIQSPSSQRVSCQLFNNNGQMVSSTPLSLQTGYQEFNLPGQNIRPGVYHLVIESNQMRKHIPFVRK